MWIINPTFYLKKSVYHEKGVLNGHILSSRTSVYRRVSIWMATRTHWSLRSILVWDVITVFTVGSKQSESVEPFLLSPVDFACEGCQRWNLSCSSYVLLCQGLCWGEECQACLNTAALWCVFTPQATLEKGVFCPFLSPVIFLLLLFTWPLLPFSLCRYLYLLCCLCVCVCVWIQILHKHNSPLTHTHTPEHLWEIVLLAISVRGRAIAETKSPCQTLSLPLITSLLSAACFYCLRRSRLSFSRCSDSPDLTRVWDAEKLRCVEMNIAE